MKVFQKFKRYKCTVQQDKFNLNKKKKVIFKRI